MYLFCNEKAITSFFAPINHLHLLTWYRKRCWFLFHRNSYGPLWGNLLNNQQRFGISDIFWCFFGVAQWVATLNNLTLVFLILEVQLGIIHGQPPPQKKICAEQCFHGSLGVITETIGSLAVQMLPNQKQRVFQTRNATGRVSTFEGLSKPKNCKPPETWFWSLSGKLPAFYRGLHVWDIPTQIST